MKITIIAVGKIKEKYWKEALAEYLQRLSAFAKVEVVELPDRDAHADTPERIQAAEGEDILKRLHSLQKGSGKGGGGSDRQLIALDAQGKQRSSEELSTHLDQLKLHGISKLTFIIGGSHGLSPKVMACADETLSFGAQTWPHNMARVMLAEQLYRAFAISNNHPYHK